MNLEVQTFITFLVQVLHVRVLPGTQFLHFANSQGPLGLRTMLHSFQKAMREAKKSEADESPSYFFYIYEYMNQFIK
jgi:hypothetical protein